MKKVCSKWLSALCLCAMCGAALCNDACLDLCLSPTLASEEIAPYADVIELRTRFYNGVFQYRHWNKTRACWVEPDWITMP